MLLTLFIVSFVLSTIWPNLLALTVLFIFEPLTFVPRSISVIVHAVAVRLIVLPLTVVYVTVGVNQATATVSLVVVPVALIQRPIDPDLNASAVFLTLLVPLASVFSTVFKLLPFFGYSD